MPEKLNLSKPRIPTSSRVWWREFRSRIVPAIVFVGVVGFVAVQLRNFDAAGIPGVAEGIRSVAKNGTIGAFVSNAATAAPVRQALFM